MVLPVVSGRQGFWFDGGGGACLVGQGGRGDFFRASATTCLLGRGGTGGGWARCGDAANCILFILFFNSTTYRGFIPRAILYLWELQRFFISGWIFEWWKYTDDYRAINKENIDRGCMYFIQLFFLFVYILILNGCNFTCRSYLRRADHTRDVFTCGRWKTVESFGVCWNV